MFAILFSLIVWPPFLGPPPALPAEVPVVAEMSDTVTSEPAEKLLVFTAKYCAPCKSFHPILDTLVKEGIVVEYVDVSLDFQQTQRNEITVVPTTIVLKSGKEVARFVGVKSAAQIKRILRPESPPRTGHYEIQRDGRWGWKYVWVRE